MLIYAYVATIWFGSKFRLRKDTDPDIKMKAMSV